MHLKEFSFSRIRFRFHEWRRVERSVLVRRNDSRARNHSPPPLPPSSSFSFSSHRRAGSSSHPFATLPTLCRVHQCVSTLPLFGAQRQIYFAWKSTRDPVVPHARLARIDFYSITIVSGAMVQNLELNIPVYCKALKIVFEYRVVLKIARISYRAQENMFYYPL